MHLAITVVALAAQVALADELPGSVQIGRPVRGVTIGASTQPYSGPLDNTVSLEMEDVTLTALLDEVGKQTKTEYILIQGVGLCRVSAFIRGLKTREFLQLLLEVGGLTYQQAGRSNSYVVTRRKGGPACEEAKINFEGSCYALAGERISAECKDGSLSSLVRLLHSQADGSFLVWSEVVNQPITIKLRNASLTDALKKIGKRDSIDVRKIGKKEAFLFAARNRKQASEELEKSTDSAKVGWIWHAPPPRYEPPANQTFKEEMPNQGIERTAPR